MRLRKFEKLIQRANPSLRVRQRGYGDIGGIFVGVSGKSGYLARISKGELHLHGYRYQIVDPKNKMKLKDGLIKKRGRRTLIEILKNYRWLNYQQAARVRWGLDPLTGGELNE